MMMHTAICFKLFYVTHWKKGVRRAKVNESRNRPGVAQRVPGDLGSQISMTFST